MFRILALLNLMSPPERLLGKSPEYIEAYTQIYKSKIASLRKTLVTRGLSLAM